MSRRDGLLPTRLTGSALASANPAAVPSRVSRRTEIALDRLESQSIVAEACVASRARLIGQATHASGPSRVRRRPGYLAFSLKRSDQKRKRDLPYW